MEQEKPRKLLSASEIRREQFLMEQRYVEHDFKLIQEELAQKFLEAIKSFACHEVSIVFRDFYRDHPKLAQTLCSKVVAHLKEKNFDIVSLDKDHLGMTIQWPPVLDLLLLEESVDESKNKNEEEVAPVELIPSVIPIEDFDARLVRLRQAEVHREAVKHEMEILERQCVEKVYEAQTQFKEDITLSLKECKTEYLPVIQSLITRKLERKQYQVIWMCGGTQLEVSWFNGDTSDDEVNVTSDPFTSPDCLDSTSTSTSTSVSFPSSSGSTSCDSSSTGYLETLAVVSPTLSSSPLHKESKDPDTNVYSKLGPNELIHEILVTAGNLAVQKQALSNSSHTTPRANQQGLRDTLVLLRCEVLNRLRNKSPVPVVS